MWLQDSKNRGHNGRKWSPSEIIRIAFFRRHRLNPFASSDIILMINISAIVRQSKARASVALSSLPLMMTTMAATRRAEHIRITTKPSPGQWRGLLDYSGVVDHVSCDPMKL